MHKGFIAFWAVVCLLVAALSVQATYDVSLTAINNTILPFEQAVYELSVTNFEAHDEIINIKADATYWVLSPQTVFVGANSTRTIRFTITPKSDVGLSNYRIPLMFTSTKTGEQHQYEVFLSLAADLYTRGYPIYVTLNVTAPEIVDPREPLSMRVSMRNNNLRDLSALEVSVTSDVFSEHSSFALGPLSSVTKVFLFTLDPLLEPGIYDYSVVVSLPNEEKIVGQYYGSIDVVGYAKIHSQRQVTERSLFKTVETITFTNEGNKKRSQSFQYAAPFFERLFTTVVPEATLIKGEDGKQYSWTISLEPQSSSQVIITHDYRILVVIIIVIILLIIAYFVLRSPIVITKEAQIIGGGHQGTNEMKVRLFVKNRSRSQVNTVKVIDRIPGIAAHVPHQHLGTLQPTKITKSERKGTIVRWEMESLEPFEERIISYKMKSKLKIVGTMTLPEAQVKFEVRGRKRISGSGLGKFV